LANGDENRSHFHAMWEVEFENSLRDSPDGCQWNDLSVHKSKMIFPFLLAWIEQRRQSAGDWIARSNIRAFEMIVFETSPRKISENALATVLFGDDVICFKSEMAVDFREQTVFANMPGAFANTLA